MTKTVAELDREIAKLQEQRIAAEKAENVIRALPLDQRIAVVLHNNLCNDNHTDECGWFYVTVENFSTKTYWLDRSNIVLANLRRVLPTTPSDEIVSIIEAVTARK